MCFTYNIRYIRTLPPSLTPSHHHGKHQALSELRRDIVLKAMFKFYPEHVVNEVRSHRRSDSTPEAVIADFERTEQPPVNVVKDYHYKRALKVVTKAFKPDEPYKPVAFPDLRYYPWNLPVSAEAPYSTSPAWKGYVAKKYSLGMIPSTAMTFNNLYDELFHINRQHIHRIKDGRYPFFERDGTPRPYYYTHLHARAHVVGPNDEDKIRAVFGVPKLLLFAENMFIWPMQADLQNRKPKDSPLLWGSEIMRGGWKQLRNLVINKTEGKFRTILSADWSQFDRRALFSIIDDVHTMWESFFDMSGTYQPTNYYPNASTQSERIHNLWRWMTYNVKHYPILLPDGRLVQWTRNGIASGYQQTQLLDSCVNAIMILTCLSKLGVNIESDRFFFKVQGDDSLIAFNESFYQIFGKERFLTLLSDEAALRFNAKLSVDKSDLHDSLDGVKVLGYFNKSGVAFRTDVDLLSHLLFPERDQNLAATAGSALGIAMAAQGCSQSVYNVCKDVFEFITQSMKVDPILSQSDIKKLRYLFGYEMPSKEAIVAEEELYFPTFRQTFYQNFQLHERSDSERNRIWPTDPSRTGGFAFL
jgi:hypothetical protein